MATELFKNAWKNIDKIGISNDFGNNMSEYDKNLPENAMDRLKEIDEDGSLKDFLLSLFNNENKQGSKD